MTASCPVRFEAFVLSQLLSGVQRTAARDAFKEIRTNFIKGSETRIRIINCCLVNSFIVLFSERLSLFMNGHQCMSDEQARSLIPRSISLPIAIILASKVISPEMCLMHQLYPNVSFASNIHKCVFCDKYTQMCLMLEIFPNVSYALNTHKCVFCVKYTQMCLFFLLLNMPKCVIFVKYTQMCLLRHIYPKCVFFVKYAQKCHMREICPNVSYA